MIITSPPASGYSGIALRQLTRSDLSAWYAYLSEPAVFGPTSWNLQGEADLLPMFDGIESAASGSIRRLAMVDEASRALIGTIGFHTISDMNRSAEIAYDLAPEYWGRGIASIVCASVVAWAFATYGWMRVQGTVLHTNQRSVNVLLRTGFRYEGLLRAYRMVRGTPGDFLLYARLATD